jgi:hypothetical protein
VIIEQLLGITLLSERAERIKEINRATKEAITGEELRIRAVQEANRRIEEQIVSLEKRQVLWQKKKQEDIQGFHAAISALEHIDIDQEVQSHRDLEAYHLRKKHIDELNKWVRQIDQESSKLEKDQRKLEQDISALREHRCHACGQAWKSPANEATTCHERRCPTRGDGPEPCHHIAWSRTLVPSACDSNLFFGFCHEQNTIFVLSSSPCPNNWTQQKCRYS